jgi:arginase family enzyme
MRKRLRLQLDCGDVPVSPFDSAIAVKQIKAAYSSMLNHPVATPQKMAELGMQKGLDGEYHPRIIALGGDHTIVRVPVTFSSKSRAENRSSRSLEL